MKIIFSILFMALVFGAAAQTDSFDPESAYATQEIEGWRILVNQKLLAQTNLSAQVIKTLSAQLFQITRVVPPPALAKIRQIPIWVELNDSLFPGSVYHESPDWLREHGENPAKAGAVEIANAKNFTTWTIEQPWMALHELSHGYHHLFLGDDFPDIINCYNHALTNKLYDSVLRSNGHRERHYAMTSAKEYFAESTEAFFGTNDFYPFVRAELKEHDPQMYALECKVWGVKP